MFSETTEKVYLQLTGDDEGRVCRDIPESACNAQPENFLKHVLALSATKAGDGIADAKLVLSWLLGAAGAPAAIVGLLVPIREAGALLPQLITAGAIRRLPLRKWAWSAGSLVQGLCVIGMGLTALALDAAGSGAAGPGAATFGGAAFGGATFGWTIVGLLALMSLGRSVCSVAYKDVLGKTVSKSTRGTATGTASTIAAAFVFAFGIALAVGLLPLSTTIIGIALCAAGGAWIVAALVFASLDEVPGATEGGGNALTVALQQLDLLRTDPQLLRFIVVRSLLTATALAPPFLLALGGRSAGGALGDLGLFVVASSLAAVFSTYLWGRLSDVSSRRVLILSGALGAVPLALAAALAELAPAALAVFGVLPGLLFVLQIAYQGVRLGRATHVVDMTDADRRAAYTALSNTIIGIVLLGTGAFGLVAQRFGDGALLGLFAGLCGAASVVALGLREVQQD